MSTTWCLLRRLIFVAACVSVMMGVSSAQTLPQPTLVHKGCPAPLPPGELICKGPPICKDGETGGTLTPGPNLPNGTGCPFTYEKFSVESKCSDGLCAAPPPGTSGWIQPKYMLIGVIYAPPGNKSQAQYLSGSTFGSTQDVATSSGNGILMGATLFGVTTSISDTETTTNDQSVTVSKSQGSIVALVPGIDDVDHDQDMFYILVNPKINFSQPYAGIPGFNLQLAPSDPTVPEPIAKLPVAVLRGTQPDTYHVMDGWSDADKKNLLAQDPFVGDSTTALPKNTDPNRFTLEQEVQVQGSQSATDPEYNPAGFQVTGGSSQCIKTTDADVLTVSVTGSYNFFSIAGASGGGSFSTGFSTSNQTCNGTSQSATVTLASNTVGYLRVISVYFDSLFATFAFVDSTPKPLPDITTPLGSNITGRITDSSGGPLPNQQINVTFANGITRTLFSDASGNYTIISPPSGAMTIRSGDLVQQASAVLNKAVVVPLKVTTPKALLPRLTSPLRPVAAPSH